MSSPFDEWLGRRRPSSWFPDVDSMMRDMEKLMQEALKNMDQQIPRNLVRERRLDDGSIVRETGPIVYGYSVKIGEDGKPIYENSEILIRFLVLWEERFQSANNVNL